MHSRRERHMPLSQCNAGKPDCARIRAAAQCTAVRQTLPQRSARQWLARPHTVKAERCIGGTGRPIDRPLSIVYSEWATQAVLQAAQRSAASSGSQSCPVPSALQSSVAHAKAISEWRHTCVYVCAAALVSQDTSTTTVSSYCSLSGSLLQRKQRLVDLGAFVARALVLVARVLAALAASQVYERELAVHRVVVRLQRNLLHATPQSQHELHRTEGMTAAQMATAVGAVQSMLQMGCRSQFVPPQAGRQTWRIACERDESSFAPVDPTDRVRSPCGRRRNQQYKAV